MKVEKDLGFVNEIPVYVNGKKSNLRVGEITTDDAVEEVLENTKVFKSRLRLPDRQESVMWSVFRTARRRR